MVESKRQSITPKSAPRFNAVMSAEVSPKGTGQMAITEDFEAKADPLELRSVERYASDIAMNFVASCSFNFLKHVIVLVLWFDATFVLIARAAPCRSRITNLPFGSRTCFSMESIKRRSRWGRSCFGAASGFDGYWLKHQTKPCCYVMFAMPLMSRSQCILTTIKSSWRSFLKKCIGIVSTGTSTNANNA
jgi:hypothetical protein